VESSQRLDAVLPAIELQTTCIVGRDARLSALSRTSAWFQKLSHRIGKNGRKSYKHHIVTLFSSSVFDHIGEVASDM
jgi:hypothetical protein